MKNAQMVVVLFLAMAVMGNAQPQRNSSYLLLPPKGGIYHMIGWGRCDTSLHVIDKTLPNLAHYDGTKGGWNAVRQREFEEAAKTVKDICSDPECCWSQCKNEGRICTFFDYNHQTDECNLHYDYSGGLYDKGNGEGGFACFKMDKW